MDEAFLELLDKKDLSFITVKEICQKAGVNRSTFYLHYETISDLLDESVEYIYSKFNSYMVTGDEKVTDKLDICPINELYLMTPEYLMPFLTFIKNHKRLFRTALNNSTVLKLDLTYGKMMKTVFSPILERCDVPKDEHDYMMRFYVRGLMAIVSEWLKKDCADSVEFIISVMQRCVGKLTEEKG